MKRTLTYIAILLGLAFYASKAIAYEQVIETIQGTNSSTGTVHGVICTSGTARQIDAIFNNLGTGFTRAWVRIGNTDSADSAFIGFDISVSTSANTSVGSAEYANLGEEVPAKASAPYSIGRAVKIYCKAADSAGASGVVLSLLEIGYK